MATKSTAPPIYHVKGVFLGSHFFHVGNVGEVAALGAVAIDDDRLARLDPAAEGLEQHPCAIPLCRETVFVHGAQIDRKEVRTAHARAGSKPSQPLGAGRQGSMTSSQAARRVRASSASSIRRAAT